MTPTQNRDLDTTRSNLCKWLAQHLDGDSVNVGEITSPVGAGFTNETLFVSASWRRGREIVQADLVVRVMPTAFTMMYRPDETFRTQYRVMKALSQQNSIPVPGMRWFEDDASWLGSAFYVMERVAGRTQPDLPPYTESGWLRDASRAEQACVWWSAVDLVAKINSLDWKATGLGFLTDGRHPDLDARLDYYDAAFDWAREGEANPVVSATREWLAGNRPKREEPAVLSWGDARLGNLIYREFEAVSVIDWEMASVGPPLQDLGWWFFTDRAILGDIHSGLDDDPKSLPGFGSRTETLQRWQAITGHSIDQINFYEVFAGFRMAVHLHRMGTLFRKLGVDETSQWATNNVATQALAQLVGVEHPESVGRPAALT